MVEIDDLHDSKLGRRGPFAGPLPIRPLFFTKGDLDMYPTFADVLDLFHHHKPSEDDLKKIETVRSAGLAMAEVIWKNVPVRAERTLALRKIHETVMYAN